MEKQGEVNNYIRDYQIIENIGFGAHGFVYKAIKKGENKILVIKQIPLCKKDKNNIEEAKNEATILKQLNCKYIVNYYESFEEDDNYFIVMEYCEKGDLSSYLLNYKKNKKKLTENEIWKFFIEISLGLSYIHQKKILHRDLKSKNIFLTKNFDIKIGDLGIAKILQDTSHAYTFIGTPFYLSPEICEEKPYNEKSDVWALGCILYELITFKHPYNASNQAALLLKIISGNYEPINSEISDDLKNLVFILLEKNYLNRPSMFEIINKPIFIDKCRKLGFYNYLLLINSLYQSNDTNLKKVKTIKKITYIRPSNNFNSFLENQSKINIKKRNKNLSSLESINSSRHYSSSNQRVINTSINEKRRRTSSIEYMFNAMNQKNNLKKNLISNKINDSKHLQNISKLNELKNSLNKISPIKNKNFQQRIASSTPSKDKLKNKSESKIKNKRFNSLSLNKFINKNPVLKRILDKVESKNLISNNNKQKKNNKKIIDKNNKGSISYRINESNKNEKINSKNIFQKNIKKTEKKKEEILKEKINDNSFEIIEQGKEKSYFDSLSNISENEDILTKKKSKKELSEFKDESDSLDEEKVYIINDKNNEKKKELLNLVKKFQEKYNQLKKEIYTYQNQINCEKIFEMYNEIDKNNNDNNKMEEIMLNLDEYIKINLPKENVSTFKEIFNNFCFYGLELKYTKMELENLE